MTSATLSVGRKDLAYFRQRIGAEEAEPALLGGPFDFQKQMKMFIVKKMPDPRDAQYEEALEHWVAHFVEKTDGRAFVLFTSYRGYAATWPSEWRNSFRKRNSICWCKAAARRGENFLINSRARLAAFFLAPTAFGWALTSPARLFRM